MRKKILTIINLIISIIIFISIIAISINIYNLDFISIIKYFIFIIIYIQLPGMLLNKILDTQLQPANLNRMLSFFVGTALLFLQYFILGLLNSLYLLRVFPLIILLIELIICFKKKRLYVSRFKLSNIYNLNSALFLLFSLILLLSMLFLGFNYIPPDNVSNFSLSQDYIWHMGNVNSLSHSFPPIDPRVSDLTFKYHYFPDLINAICKIVTNIPAHVQAMFLSPFLISYMVVDSLYSLFFSFIKSQKKSNLFVLLSFISCCVSTYFVINAPNHSSLYIDHLLTNVNGVGYALPCFVVLVILIKDFLQKYILTTVSNNDGIIKDILYVIILMLLCTGLKGPFSSIIIGGLIILTCLLLIFKQKNIQTKKLILLLLACSISFASIYLIFIKAPTPNRGVKLSLTDTISNSNLIAIVNNYSSGTFNKLISCLFSYFINFIFILSAFSLPFIIYSIFQVKKFLNRKNKFDSNNVISIFLVICSILGLGAYYLLSQSGLSQLYFLFAVIPLIQVITLISIYDCSLKKIFRTIIAIWVVFLSIISSFYTSSYVKDLYTGSLNTENAILVSNNFEYTTFSNSTLSNKEYQALLWISENTPIDSIFMTDRLSLSVPIYDSNNFLNNRFFYYSAYSDRQFFLEGFSYSSISEELLNEKLSIIDTVYQNDSTTNIEKILIDNNINYLVVNKSLHPNLGFTDKNLIKCYSNSLIDIYKLK